MAITKKQRDEVESLVYQVMDTLDKTGTNTDYYKKLFANMSDDQLVSFFRKEYPLKFHTRNFEIEPTMTDIEKAAKIIKVPLLEKVKLPHQYIDENGVPVTSKECLVGYTHIKRVQQMITKKNSMSTDIKRRDMKTGLLNNDDKNGKTSDRETEALKTMQLVHSVDELTTFRADSMNSKNIAYNIISTTGQLSLKDVPIDPTDSLAKNLFDAYLIGAHLKSNILTNNYVLPHTLKTVAKRNTAKG